MLVLLINVLMMYSLVTYTDGYNFGAPVSACNTMSPSGHGAAAQTSPSPYTVTPSTTAYTSGDSINVTLSGDTFKGFLCQARPDVNSATTVGTLIESDGSSSTTNNCAGKASITQNSGADKSSIQLTWTHSGESTGDIYFVCTVIQNQTVFWEKVTSSKLSSGCSQIIPSVILMYVCIALGAFKTPIWRQ